MEHWNMLFFPLAWYLWRCLHPLTMKVNEKIISFEGWLNQSLWNCTGCEGRKKEREKFAHDHSRYFLTAIRTSTELESNQLLNTNHNERVCSLDHPVKVLFQCKNEPLDGYRLWLTAQQGNAPLALVYCSGVARLQQTWPPLVDCMPINEVSSSDLCLYVCVSSAIKLWCEGAAVDITFHRRVDITFHGRVGIMFHRSFSPPSWMDSGGCSSEHRCVYDWAFQCGKKKGTSIEKEHHALAVNLL